MRIPDLSNIPEQGPVAEDEYTLKITKAQDVKSERTGREGMMFICQIVGEENAAPVFHRIWFPFDSEDESKQTTMWRMVKEFIEGVGLDPSASPEPRDFQGIEFTALLRLTEDQNGRPVNEIARLM